MTTETETTTEEANDITNLHRLAGDARRHFEAVTGDDADVDAGFTALSRIYGDDDFDDEGNYVADEDVDVTVTVEFKASVEDVAEDKVGVLRQQGGDVGFDVEEAEISGYYRTPVDSSGTFDQPVGGLPDREPDGFTVTVELSKTVDDFGADWFDGDDDLDEVTHPTDEFRNFECPDCGEVVTAWCDCPACGWYDEDAWEATLGDDEGRNEAGDFDVEDVRHVIDDVDGIHLVTTGGENVALCGLRVDGLRVFGKRADTPNEAAKVGAMVNARDDVCDECAEVFNNTVFDG